MSKLSQEKSNEDLVQLALELYARTCSQPHNEAMHHSAFAARDEVVKRLNEFQSQINTLETALLDNSSFCAGVERENESLQSQIPRWVPVEERLPEIGDRFLVYDSFYENKRDDTGFCIQFGRITESWGITPVGMNGECPTVTHWMPLPPEPLETEE